MTAGGPRLPDFVIIGAQKAASTLLQESLRTHEKIWLARGEDPFFRDPVYTPNGLSRFEESSGLRSEQRVGIKCPDYLGRPEVAPRLLADLSQPDLIVCLRNPVSRAVSAYYWWMRWGIIPLESPEVGLRKILNGSYGPLGRAVAPILEWGRYYEHLSHYLEYFPREKIHIVLDDDLRSDAARVVRETHKFLGVEPVSGPSPVAGRGNPGIYSLPRLRFLNSRSRSMLKWDEGEAIGSVPMPSQPGAWLFCKGVAAVDRYVLSLIYGNPRPKLSSDLERRLFEYYRDDVASLETLLARDLSGWRPSEIGIDDEDPTEG